MAAGDQSLWKDLSSAARPLMCGQDIDVPETMLNFTRLLSVSSCVGLIFDGHAAKMFTPGPVTSGLIMLGSIKLGPREENAAKTGAGSVYFVPSNLIMAVDLDDEFMYFLTASAAEAPNDVAGKTCGSAKSSSP